MVGGMKHMEEQLDRSLRDVLQIMQGRIMAQTTYFGIKALKSPIDFWVYQEIMFETKPDYVVEIGNFRGGSTLALAHICEALGKGRVIGIDLSHEDVPELVRRNPRIELIEGDACASFDQVKRRIKSGAEVLVIEDSSHTFENTLRVLETYCELVKPGGYLVVEDSICHHGLDVGPDPGPYEAIEVFVRQNPQFEVDRSKESFLITWNPKGYLTRTR
jgi:cephalosporin hydroxylase